MTGSRALIAALTCVAVGAAPAHAAVEEVTLDPTPQVALYGSNVRLAGAVTPARQTRVEVLSLVSGLWELVAAGESRSDGSFSFPITARRPTVYIARTDAAESSEALLRIRPLLTASFAGPAVLGAPLRVVGRVQPADAGELRLTVHGRTHTVQLDAGGRFAERVSTRRARRLGVTLEIDPAEDYVATGRQLAKRVRAPHLRFGSRGAAVRFLEQRLKSLSYVLLGVDRAFRADTRDALYAFQKVRGLPRDGMAGPRVWRALLKARDPLAAVPRGNHIEIDKARQVLFEVRRGRVVQVVHVSTGATGNTPLGRWRVYRKSPGFNSLSMYYTLYFLRGFAVHGYHSVPTWPASHGCVRLPIWFAPRLYRRWSVGSIVWVLPTTSRSSPLWRSPAAVARARPPAPAGAVGP